MTPEERASEWMGSPYTADEREANARLAALFRAAENDALERAAATCETEADAWSEEIAEYGNAPIREAKVVALRTAAKNIRDMKRDPVSS